MFHTFTMRLLLCGKLWTLFHTFYIYSLFYLDGYHDKIVQWPIMTKMVNILIPSPLYLKKSIDSKCWGSWFGKNGRSIIIKILK